MQRQWLCSWYNIILLWLRSGYIVVLSPHYEPLTFAWLNQHSAHWAIALACLMVLSHLLFLCVQLHKLILESVYRLWAQCVMATQHEPSSRCSWAEGTRVAPIINGRVVKLECKHKKVEAYTWWEDKERKCNNCFSSAPSICCTLVPFIWTSVCSYYNYRLLRNDTILFNIRFLNPHHCFVHRLETGLTFLFDSVIAALTNPSVPVT